MALSTSRVNKQLPPHLSDLLRRLCDSGGSFVELYEKNEKAMRDIVKKLGKISEAVKERQREATLTRLFGAACGGLGIVMGVAAVVIGVSSATQMATVGCTAAIAGGTAVITANIFKAMEEKTSIETVENLGKAFMAITKELKNVLEEIKRVSEELDEKSSSLMTRTGAQVKRGLSKTTELEPLLKQVGELAEKSRNVMTMTLTMQNGVRELLNVITRITPTSAEDEQFTICITESASQCEKTFNDLAELRAMLKDFEEMQTE